MARCFIFSKPVKGENFLRYPLSSKPNDFMPLIARKNQGSTPMPPSQVKNLQKYKLS